VRYSEVDPQRAVYHARYLEYCDTALVEFFRALGWQYQQLLDDGCDLALVKTSVTFRAPAVLDDVLEIVVGVARVGTSSVAVEFNIQRLESDDELVIADTVYVNVGVTSRRPRRLPDDVRAALLARERPARRSDR
jgi:acyl-CoA thioester hydrolase